MVKSTHIESSANAFHQMNDTLQAILATMKQQAADIKALKEAAKVRNAPFVPTKTAAELLGITGNRYSTAISGLDAVLQPLNTRPKQYPTDKVLKLQQLMLAGKIALVNDVTGIKKKVEWLTKPENI